MKFTRRSFLAIGAGAGALSLAGGVQSLRAEASDDGLEAAGSKPVFVPKDFKTPVLIESIELLRKGKEHFVRVRSKDGAEGISVDDGRMDVLHPILNKLVIPYVLGKDARELEEHLFEVYRYQSNYKLQGLALWCPVA